MSECRWCGKEMNGANDYQLAGFCNADCRHKGGDTDKIDLVAEIGEVPLPPATVIPVEVKPNQPVKVQVEVFDEVVPSLESFFQKPVLGDK